MECCGWHGRRVRGRGVLYVERGVWVRQRWFGWSSDEDMSVEEESGGTGGEGKRADLYTLD